MNLLTPGEPSPVIVRNAGAASPFLLIGDHAGREIPRALGDLGVAPREMKRHIAWDIGVADLGLRLADMLGASFVSQRYSRLVIDCNRAPQRADSIPTFSDGIAIPGNAGLSQAAADARRRAIHQPYHDRIAHELDRRGHAGLESVLVSLHSFTPQMAGDRRPWGFGVLHDGDSAFSDAVLERLTAVQARPVGDNLPYRMDEVDYTVPLHARARGLAYLELEIRQDILAKAGGRDEVARLLVKVLPQAREMVGASSAGR